MRWFNDLPLMVKVLVAPALSVVLLVVVGGVLYTTYSAIGRASEDASRNNRASAQFLDVMLDVAGAHGEMLRAVTLKQSKVPAPQIEAAVANALDSLKEAEASLAAMPSLGIPAVDDGVAGIGDVFAVYQKGAAQTLDAATVDAFMASMYLTNAHLAYGKFSEAWRGVADTLSEVDAASAAVAGAALTRAAVSFLLAAGIAVVVVLAVALAVGRAIARPTVALTGVMNRLADGDKVLEIEGTGRRDELGAMARAVVVFRDGLIRADELAAASEQDQEARNRRTAAMEDMTRRFEGQVAGLLDGMAAAAHDLQGTAHGLSGSAGQGQEQTAICAGASEQASGNVQTVASAAEELAASISEIGRQVRQSSELAGTAARATDASNHQVHTLAEAAGRIGEVVQLITSIAEQTNLLALNATIEAARAGDAGKGFAVVASEVKSLANKTAEATKEIIQQIDGIQAATEGTVGSIEEIAKQINKMNEIAGQVAVSVEEQNTATQEIARSVQQAAGSTAEVAGSIVSVAQAATDTGQAAGEVLSRAVELSDQAGQLKACVQQFLSEVKAA